MTSIAAPVCVYCKYLDRTGQKFPDVEEGLCCDAFPKGIPKKVLYDGDDHKNPLPGDNGIQFEPIKK